MDRRTFLATASCLPASGPAALAREPTKAEIQRLIERLGSRKFAEREQASRALARMDRAAIAALRKAAEQHADAEVRRRAAALVARFDERHLTEHVQAIIEGKLSPIEKGRKLQPFLTFGMSEADVQRLLGQPDDSRRGFAMLLCWYPEVALVIVYAPFGDHWGIDRTDVGVKW